MTKTGVKDLTAEVPRLNNAIQASAAPTQAIISPEARQGAGSIGNSGVAGMIAGGDPAGAATTTAAEEWTANNTLSTVTVS